MESQMDIQRFFPEELEVISIEEAVDQIDIRLKSRTKSCVCPHCGAVLTKRRATYNRRAQDLSMLGKTVMLTVNAYEYHCPDCVRPIAERFEGFLVPGGRLTERCSDLIVQLALETSCEGASRILKQMGIRYSGDSIIRLLLKRLSTMPAAEVGEVIGVDDFAYRKRHTYGTVIVDTATHRPIALLDGRDGSSLKEWLQGNKQVKVVTRDRASEYAKAIREELPDAIQVADRFHLYDNLLEAVKKALNAELRVAVPAEPVENAFPTAAENTVSEGEGKKRVLLLR